MPFNNVNVSRPESDDKYLIFSPDRRVHITKTTLEYLGDKFEVEAGHGATRETYLADHKIETFLIVPPKVRAI